MDLRNNAGDDNMGRLNEVWTENSQAELIQSCFHSGPVTALCCFGNVVLAGVGSRVLVYRVTDTECLTSTLVLPGQVVHGLKTASMMLKSKDIEICVYGGQFLRLIKLNLTSGHVTPSSEAYQLFDWIWAVTWLQDCSCLAVALAHNTIVIWDHHTARVKKTIQCQENCILYTATFLSQTLEELVLAAGTVFNQVVIWGASGTVFHRLAGHQGVIFSVAYDPVTKRICSASDDRSIRLSQLKFPMETDSPCPTYAKWGKVQSDLLHVMYGHSARVWNVQLLTDVLVSVGEDSTCCVWGYDGTIKQKFKGHKGKSIWSLCVSEDEMFVVTGGGDNSIRQWYFEQEDEQADGPETSLKFEMSENDFPRIVQLLDFDNVLIMTNKGILLLHNLQTRSWMDLITDEKFGSYSLLAVSQDGEWISVGNLQGIVRIICISGKENITSEKHQTCFYDEMVHQGKIFSLKWMSKSQLLVSGPDGLVKLMQVSCGLQKKIIVETLVSFVLPPCRHCWVTAAILLQTSGWFSVICGDRCGSVYVYNWQEGNQMASLDQRFVQVHGKTGVTDICFHDNSIYTAGRDGIYRNYRWSDKTRQMELLNNNRLFKGMEWLERLVFTPDGDRIIYGFYSNKFVVWSVEQNQKLLQIPCGGGHRTWDFKVNSSNHGDVGRLVFLKQRQVLFQESALSSCQKILKASLHGREMCDVKYLQSFSATNGELVDIVATASEDTTICISAVSQQPGCVPKLKVLMRLQEHISSVRHLAVCSSDLTSQNTHRKLIFSAGGRAQIRVWRVELNQMQQSSSSSPDHTEANSLQRNGDRVHDKEVSPKTIEASQHFPVDVNVSDVNVSDVNVSDVNVSDVNVRDVNVSNVNVSDVNASNVSVSDVNASNVSVSDVNASDVNVSDVNASDVNVSDVNVSDVNVSDVNASDVNVSDVNVSDVNVSDVNVSDVNVSDVNVSDVNVSDVNVSDVNVGVNVESLTGIQLGQKDGPRKKKPWRNRLEHVDPETRFLALTVFSAAEVCQAGSQSLYLLSAACSDGFVRFYGFNENARTLTELALSPFHDHCVLKVVHVIHKVSGQTTRCFILSGATDGRIAFWDVTDLVLKYVQCNIACCHDSKQPEVCNETTDSTAHQTTSGLNVDEAVSSDSTLKQCHSSGDCKNVKHSEKERVRETEISDDIVPVFILTCHQSGVNSLHITPCSENTYMLVSGGDDNAVQVSMIAIDTVVKETEDGDSNGHLEIRVVSEGGNLSAHSAEITGVCCLGNDRLLTTSIDQRVNIWSVCPADSPANLQLKLMSSCISSVADIANIDLWSSRNSQMLAVCGEGLEIFNITDKTESM